MCSVATLKYINKHRHKGLMDSTELIFETGKYYDFESISACGRAFPIWNFTRCKIQLI